MKTEKHIFWASDGVDEVLHQRLGCHELLWVRSRCLKVCCVLIQHCIAPVSQRSGALRLAPIIWNSFATLVSMFLQITGRPAALKHSSLFVCVQCTLVINFVLLLFVPVFLRPLFWASSPRSTRLDVFFLCAARQLPNWMMNVPLFLCNWTANSLIGLEDPPPPPDTHTHTHTHSLSFSHTYTHTHTH